jgi:hypothetical protein
MVIISAFILLLLYIEDYCYDRKVAAGGKCGHSGAKADALISHVCDAECYSGMPPRLLNIL